MDGSSLERAVVIKARSTFEGIKKEFSYISGKHGKENVDWKVTSQALLQGGNKYFDEIQISVVNGKDYTYFFDISKFYGKL